MLFFLLSIVFAVLSILLFSGRGSSLIAGYNTMPEDQKAQYNELRLCRFMGVINSGFTIGFVLMGTASTFKNNPLIIISSMLIIISASSAIIFPKTKHGNKYLKNMN